MPLTPYSNVVRGVEPTSFAKMDAYNSLSSMLSLKLATLFPILGLFLSPFTLTYFFLFFLLRLVQLEHWEKRKQIPLVISDSIQYAYFMKISVFS